MSASRTMRSNRKSTPRTSKKPSRAATKRRQPARSTARKTTSARRRRFAPATLQSIRDAQVIGIRAGSEPHRFIAIWTVVADDRVFVRSWSLKPRSWFRAFLKEPRGVMTVRDREIPVRAVFTKSERLKDAVSRAYLEKYDTPGSLRFARDLGRPKSRATTTELVPW